MTAIQKVNAEIVPSDQRTKAEQLEAYIGEMVTRRIAEIMARQDLAVYQPFFESKKTADELRRIQTAPEWHRFRILFERYGCMVCQTREEAHSALGMCRNCYHRNGHRLRQIAKELNKKCERVEDLIEQERLAYQAYREATRMNLPEPKALPVPSDRPKSKTGRPKGKPSIVAGDPGARVRQLRELVGMSQADLATAAGVDRGTVIDFEQGKHRALPSHRLAIRKVLVESIVRAFWPD